MLSLKLTAEENLSFGSSINPPKKIKTVKTQRPEKKHIQLTKVSKNPPEKTSQCITRKRFSTKVQDECSDLDFLWYGCRPQIVGNMITFIRIRHSDWWRRCGATA